MLGVLLLGAGMLLRTSGAPIWLLRTTIIAQGIAGLWFLVAIVIWAFRVLRPSPSGTVETSREVPQILWRLGGGRRSPEARKWAMVMLAGFMLIASFNSVSELPALLHVTAVVLAATLIFVAYWRLEKISDETADELILQIRQRALRFTISGQCVVWFIVHLLNQAGLLQDFRWSFQHLAVLTGGLYLVGSVVVSRRYL